MYDKNEYLIILQIVILLCVFSCIFDVLNGTGSIVRMSDGPGSQPSSSRYRATGTSLGTDAGPRLPRTFTVCHREPPASAENCNFQAGRPAPKGRRKFVQILLGPCR